MKAKPLLLSIASLLVLIPPLVSASSHREAPFISTLPQEDGTDFYMFRSYESGRSDYVTLIANYIPLQDPTGGPIFFELDPNGLYAINVDNTGDGKPDLSFQFQFQNTLDNLAVPSGSKQIPVPIANIGPIASGSGDPKNLNIEQTYTIKVVRNGSGSCSSWCGGSSGDVTNKLDGSKTFVKPFDNVGNKSIPDYQAYANQYIYNVNIPGCGQPGRVFVGQRKEGFVVNVGEIFDLVNLNPVGPRDGEPNSLHMKNVTSIAMEVPIACLKNGNNPIIGGWTTSSIRSARIVSPFSDRSASAGTTTNGWTQVSRLGMPLVNEVVIGLPDKDKFNGSQPASDAQFLNYVTNPSLAVLLNTLFGSAAKIPGTPRNDLVAVFLTGVKGLNQPAGVHPAEMERLNTSIAPTPPASQNDLGVLGGDKAGFPNGRRPYDDVVDIELRAMEGALCGVAGSCGSETKDPNNGAPYTDQTRSAGPDAANVRVTGKVFATDTYLDTFPYLMTPIPGSPNSALEKASGDTP